MKSHTLYHRHRFRPRIQRCFVDWMQSNRQRFLTPLRLKSRTDRAMTFMLPGQDSKIEVVLTRWEINVAVIHEGECWDLLTSLETIPELAPSGFYYCLLCKEPPEYFVSREVLWQVHLFEPFLEWLNTTLISKPKVELHQSGGATWATLAS